MWKFYYLQTDGQTSGRHTIFVEKGSSKTLLSGVVDRAIAYFSLHVYMFWLFTWFHIFTSIYSLAGHCTWMTMLARIDLESWLNINHAHTHAGTHAHTHARTHAHTHVRTQVSYIWQCQSLFLTTEFIYLINRWKWVLLYFTKSIPLFSFVYVL